MPEQEKSLVVGVVGKESSPVLARNRVLILGSRFSGVFKLGRDFQAFLEERGIPNFEVEVLRDAGQIELAFLGREDLVQGRSDSQPTKGVILLPEMRQYTPLACGCP